MRRAAAKGTKSGRPIGRPRVDAEKERVIQRLLRGGTGINKTAATVGVGTATVQRVRTEMGPFESEAAAGSGAGDPPGGSFPGREDPLDAARESLPSLTVDPIQSPS
jgi:hypothetical protein